MTTKGITMPDLTAEEQALVDARAKEYGTYVATESIDIRGARAFNVGDPVPPGHVEGYRQGRFNGNTGKVEYTDVPPVVDKSKVAKVNTKAAQAATGQEG